MYITFTVQAKIKALSRISVSFLSDFIIQSTPLTTNLFTMKIQEVIKISHLISHCTVLACLVNEYCTMAY